MSKLKDKNLFLTETYIGIPKYSFVTKNISGFISVLFISIQFV